MVWAETRNLIKSVQLESHVNSHGLVRSNFLARFKVRSRLNRFTMSYRFVNLDTSIHLQSHYPRIDER